MVWELMRPTGTTMEIIGLEVVYVHRYGGALAGAYANQQDYAWLNTRWGERVIFFHGNNTVQTKHW